MSALMKRAIIYGNRNAPGDWQRKVDDYSVVVQLEDARVDQVAKALFNRGICYEERNAAGDWQRRVDDFSAVIQLEDAPAQVVAAALNKRAISYINLNAPGDWQRKVDDYSAVIQLEDAPVAQVATALNNRGMCYGQRNAPGDLQREIDDYSVLINLEDAPTHMVATALNNRGCSYSERKAPGDWQREVDDYNAVIQFEDAPAAQIAKALRNRGVCYSQRNAPGDWQCKVDDYNAVIQLEDAPVEEVAKALFNRGVSYSQRNAPGDCQLQVDDYSAVIKLDDAPPQQVAAALAARGSVYIDRGMEVSGRSDFQNAYGITEIPGHSLLTVAISLTRFESPHLRVGDKTFTWLTLAMEGLGKTERNEFYHWNVLRSLSERLHLPLLLHRLMSRQVSGAGLDLTQLATLAETKTRLEDSTASVRSWLEQLEASDAAALTGMTPAERCCWQRRLELAYGDPLAVRDAGVDWAGLRAQEQVSGWDVWSACLWFEALWSLHLEDVANAAFEEMKVLLQRFAEQPKGAEPGAYVAAGAFCWNFEWDELAGVFAERSGDVLAGYYLRWKLSDEAEAEDEPQRFLAVLRKEKQLQETARWGYLFHAEPDEAVRGIDTPAKRQVLDRWLNMEMVEPMLLDFAEHARLDPVGMTEQEQEDFQKRKATEDASGSTPAIEATIDDVVAEMAKHFDREGWSVREMIDRELRCRRIAQLDETFLKVWEERPASRVLASVRQRFQDSYQMLLGGRDLQGRELIEALAAVIQRTDLVRQKIRIYDVLNLLVCEQKLKPNDWLLLTLYTAVKRKAERDGGKPGGGGMLGGSLAAEGSTYVLLGEGGGVFLAALTEWSGYNVIRHGMNAAATWLGLKNKQSAFPEFAEFCNELEQHWSSHFSPEEHKEQCIQDLRAWMQAPPVLKAK